MGKRSEFKRRKADKYLTPYKPVVPLIPHLSPGCRFIEPCAGDGRLVQHLQRHGLECVAAFDTQPDSLFVRYGDALNDPLPPADKIITNPPWTRTILHAMIDRFRRHVETWLLFDADWAHTGQSAELMRFCSDIVPVGRVRWIEGTTNDGKDNAAWYRFQLEPCDTIFHPKGC